MSIHALQQQLLDRVIGQLPALPTSWQTAFTVTPRHLFIPTEAACSDIAGNSFPINQATDVDKWLEAVYSDSIILTQWDSEGVPTSSSSLPFMVMSMLEHLAVEPGNKVLEIGTGTGWNTALLAARLGERSVYSIEIDPHLSGVAKANLAKLGLVNVSVITGDGAEGWEPGASYDRVIATVAANRIPFTWVSQTRAGGVIVTPWDTVLGLGALVKLIVDDDGSAHGSLVDTADFMWLREQRFAPPDEPDNFDEFADLTSVTVDLDRGVRETLARFAIGLRVPDCKAYGWASGETIWLLARESWACVNIKNNTVQQLGPRRLWDEVEAAYCWWTGVGSPDLERFGLSVRRDGQAVWLDEPHNVIAN